MLLSSNFKLQDYEKIGNIGQGAFGKVYKIKHKTDSIIYAAKETDQINLREFQILYQINHPLIVKFIGLSKTNFQNCPNPVIITEYIPNKSLEYYIDLSIRGLAPQEFKTQKIIIIYGIALAMAFLHKNKILHRDLKPANILLDNSFHPIICDFGLSKKENTSDTLEYLSPEIISDNKYTEAGDVYAFGMIVYELIFNKKPFNDIKNLFDLATKIENGERPPIEGPIPTSFQNLIESCWAQDPKKRPSFANIVDQMKNDDGFITELVDEGQYYDFIDQMDEIKTEFTPMPDLISKDYEKLSPKKMFEYAKNKEDMDDYKEARRCFQIAATTQDIISCRYYELKECRDSMLSYTLMCKKGNGGPVDIPSYIEYLKKTANFALPQASYLYGLELEKGELFTKNLDLAALYFRSSADYSNYSAIRKYIEYLSKGIGVRKNVFKALKYCKKLIKSRIKNEGLKKYQNVLDHINDIDETNDVNEIFEKDNINMRSGIIYFNNREYKNDVNTICSGSQSLDEQLIELERRRLNIYPQGFEYCKNLMNVLKMK